MQFKDEARWKRYLKEAGEDPYGKAVSTVAARWGELMESQVEKGIHVDGVAWVLFKTANIGVGLSGFQAGCAVKMLTDCWAHGEALRVWWNTFNNSEALNATPGAVADPSSMDGGSI